MLNTKDTEVLCLDLLAPTPSNMLSPQVFWYVMGLATSGRVRAVLGGPPCRTVSALRYQEDGGPGVLRSDEYPYGLPDLEPRDAELVLQDTTLWVRMLLAYALCEDARMDLAPEGPQTAFVLEQPEDPARYRSKVDIEKHRYFSMWRTTEWRTFQDRYNVSLLHFDQCTMGHQIRKPTTLGVVMDELATLDGMRGSSEVGKDNADRSQMSMREKCAQSKQWAAWAPGLKAAIAEGVTRYLGRLPTCASPRGVHLRPLSATILSQWKEHYLHDHHPSRRDCVHCVRAAARSRPHRRVEHAEAYTLSMDLTGKLDVGKDQENETVHYLLVAVYTFPTTRDGKSLVPLPGQPEEDHPLPPLNEEVAEGGEMPGGIPGEDVADVDEAHPVDADENIFNEEMEVDEEPTGADAIRVEAMETALSTWEKLIQESKNVSVRNLTFVEPVATRAIQHVLPAVARIHSRLRQLGLPVMRMHTDRAKEFRSGHLRRWTLDRSIVHTMTPADAWKCNGREENEVQQVKKLIKTLISAEKCDLEQWPLAARQVGERRLRQQLQSVGWPTKPLLPFGSKAYALRKWWQHRYEPWREVREPVRIMGPAKFSSITSTSYYVISEETGKWFYTNDMVIPEPNQPVEEDRVVYVPELAPDDVRPEPLEAPTHRVRGKQAPAMVSTMTTPWTSYELELEDQLSSGGESSWTLQTRSSMSSPQSRSTGEELEVCGGDMEGVPNTWAGGSHPGTPMHDIDVLDHVQQNLIHYLADEMKNLDATDKAQACWLPIVSEAIRHKSQVEAQLKAIHDAELQRERTQVEKEFLVTRTVGNQEVWSHLDDWKEAITNEFRQLVEVKKAVEPISKQELRRRAELDNLELEILPWQFSRRPT
eukprot:Skav234025  [mRNA]  locus=scaffold1243:187385:190006:+ [translate_table: standard]